MPVELGRLALDPPVFLAPMAGITDVPFGALAARFGAGRVVSLTDPAAVMAAPRGIGDCAPVDAAA